MAYQRIVPTLLSADGTVPVDTVSDIVNGNVVTNPSTLMVELENPDVASAEVTFITAATLHGYAVADHPVTLAAGERRTFAHFNPDVFGADLAFTCPVALNVRAYR